MRSPGRSQTRPWVRPVSAPIGFVEALKMTLRHCGPRLEGPERRVALDVPLHHAGLHDPARRKRRAADHALDVARDRLLVPKPVLDGRDAAVREGMGCGCDRRLGVHGLRRDDAEVARGQLGGVARRAGPADDVPGAREPQAAAVDRGDMELVQVERPHLDAVEQGEVRREQRPNRPTAHDRDPHSE